jgi:hypothetical protein
MRKDRNKERFFLVSYTWSDGYSNGNGMCSLSSHSGRMPDMDFIRDFASEGKKQDIVITSMYEFPTRRDYKQFYKRERVYEK